MRKDKEKQVKGYVNGRRKQSGLVKPQAIQGMKEIMGTKDQTFQGTEIQDAAEFFGLLFSEVREESWRPTSSFATLAEAEEQQSKRWFHLIHANPSLIVQIHFNEWLNETNNNGKRFEAS